MPRAKIAILLPGRDKQAGGLVGLIPSVKQSRYRRGQYPWELIYSLGKI